MGGRRHETLIERLARESGWLICEQEGDWYLLRHIDGTEMRYIQVRHRDDREFVVFAANFPVRFPLSAISSDLTVGLLRRNREVYFGAWSIDVVGSCELGFTLRHTAIKAGLTAGVFDAICLEMSGERDALHRELRGQMASLQRATLTAGRPLNQQATGTMLTTGKPGEIVWMGP